MPCSTCGKKKTSSKGVSIKKATKTSGIRKMIKNEAFTTITPDGREITVRKADG